MDIYFCKKNKIVFTVFLFFGFAAGRMVGRPGAETGMCYM